MKTEGSLQGKQRKTCSLYVVSKLRFWGEEFQSQSDCEEFKWFPCNLSLTTPTRIIASCPTLALTPQKLSITSSMFEMSPTSERAGCRVCDCLTESSLLYVMQIPILPEILVVLQGQSQSHFHAGGGLGTFIEGFRDIRCFQLHLTCTKIL